MTDFKALLNAAQYEAVTAPDGPLLVLAAAGTGKTRALVYRVAYLVEKNVPADAILLLTFTNRAASEMLDRAADRVGTRAGGVWGGTFHHVANRMLRRFATRLKYEPNFVIIDRDDSRAMVSQCVKDLKVNSKAFPKRELLLSWFGQAANREVSVEAVLETRAADVDVNPADVVRVWEQYETTKRRVNGMDFDDLLVNGLELLRTQKDVLAAYQSQFQHVLVDEYQDTNALQSQFVDLLAEQHRNLMVVGDDFQCIYSWRGADFKNIMNFPERYPDARIVKLEENYRSVPEVLEVANACITGNPEQFQKTLRPTRETYRRPRVMVAQGGQDQARGVVEIIQRFRRQGYRYQDMAVLYRAHFHSMDVQVALRRSRVPYRLTSGVGVFEQAHVKDVLSFLRVAESRTDEVAFRRLLGLLFRVGPRSTWSAWQKMKGEFDSSSAEQRENLLKVLSPKAREQWQPISDLLAAYHAADGTMTGPDAIERFLDIFYDAYVHKSFDNPVRRLDDLQELAMQIESSPTLSKFLSEIALLTNIDHEYSQMQGAEAEQIHLSTVHQAKGLEWPVVIMLWVVEGMFPSARSLGETESDAEERRLFYVAVTRAKDELVLGVPEFRRMRDGGFMPCENSRFIDELPPRLLHMYHA